MCKDITFLCIMDFRSTAPRALRLRDGQSCALGGKGLRLCRPSLRHSKFDQGDSGQLEPGSHNLPVSRNFRGPMAREISADACWAIRAIRSALEAWVFQLGDSEPPVGALSIGVFGNRFGAESAGMLG